MSYVDFGSSLRTVQGLRGRSRGIGSRVPGVRERVHGFSAFGDAAPPVVTAAAEDAPTIEDAATEARTAVLELRALADVGRAGATTATESNIAAMVADWCANGAQNAIQTALSTNNPAILKTLQDDVALTQPKITGAFESDAIDRFVTFNMASLLLLAVPVPGAGLVGGAIASTMPPALFEAVSPDAIITSVIGKIADLPWYVLLAGGLASAVGVAYLVRQLRVVLP